MYEVCVCVYMFFYVDVAELPMKFADRPVYFRCSKASFIRTKPKNYQMTDSTNNIKRRLNVINKMKKYILVEKGKAYLRVISAMTKLPNTHDMPTQEQKKAFFGGAEYINYVVGEPDENS